MGRPGPKKTQRYGVEFKRAAVQLSQRPGIEVKAVADALDIHPFMLSRWRKEFREGRLRPRAGQPELRGPKAAPEREVRRLQQLEREHRLLQEEQREDPSRRAFDPGMVAHPSVARRLRLTPGVRCCEAHE